MESILGKQAKQKKYYNKGAKPLEQLKEGDRVKLQPFTLGQRNWSDGQVVRKMRPRSYEVLADGKLYVRNRRHLRKCVTSEDAEPVVDELPSPGITEENPTTVDKETILPDERQGENEPPRASKAS